MNTAIALRDVVKAFGDFKAVDGVSFEIPSGEIFGLLGPNGAGKSTTIRMIMDIIRPDSGSISVNGKPSPEHVRNQVGYLPEERGLYKKMKVLDVLEFQGSLKGSTPRDARADAKTWLAKLEISDWADKKVEELSKGMQQKIQFAAAVLGKPPILILDEPFSGMDPVNQNLFKDRILELNRQGTTIVFSTHQMETAERLCKEIALINKGRLVLSGPLHKIKEGFGKNSVLIEYDGDGAFLAALPGVARIDAFGSYSEIRLEAGADPQSILRAVAGRLRVTKFELVAPTLHNIFIEKVGGVQAPVLERVGDA
ncbi:MAG TPA: ATP-binding cassette domain-containing protein [Candidatus Polarisedimenticolaceae bacterium]|nr:ATP-binding cassette domain-containing protein [Candidatus Polarisedimenticolaceae bacterium]